MKGYPHVPASFINAIAEEGTKEEAIKYLQEQWNETCALRAALKPFARNPRAISLSAALGHIEREDLLRAEEAYYGRTTAAVISAGAYEKG